MDGIILVNKEKDFTSHDVVSIVKKITESKVGHTGTLDPNATGVLPLLIGNATKISKYLINHDKEYEAVIQLGKKTTTADIEGEVIEEKEVPEKIYIECENILKSFIGKQKQTPPAYSAIKVNGKKLYSYAREGIKIEIEPRNIEIYNIELMNINKEEKQISFRVSCSKGTYIRSLCEDIADKLGTVGYMKDLKRTKVGDFEIKEAITIDELKEKFEKNDFSDVITIENIFKDMPKIELNENNIKQYLNGVKITEKNQDGIYRIFYKNEFNGIGIVKDNKLKRDLVIAE
jgi:tRNA pseudouridine55 synthase